VSEARGALERLCARFGVATEYDDIWGARHMVSDENLVALLAAFDVDASTPERMAQAERAAHVAACSQALPPVVTCEAGVQPWSVVLRLPAAMRRLQWTVVEESGAKHGGESDPTMLAQRDFTELDGQRYCNCTLRLALELPLGYHTLRIDGLPGACLIIAAPRRCYRPPGMEDGGRVWGPAVQLYGLRSQRNWGIGDFGDLARLLEQWADRGAGIVGVNPLHALFSHNPAHASPYSPSSRLRLNPLYLDVEVIEDFRTCEEAQRQVRSAPFQARLARLRDEPLVDYPGVAAAKFEIFETLYTHFRLHQLAPRRARARGFREFQKKGGEALRLHAAFEALQAHFHANDTSIWGWPVWPQAFRDPGSSAVVRFVAEHLERVEFHEYLQWQAEHQLAQLGRRVRARGLAVGLYFDLAVSVDRAGSDTWSHAGTYAHGASIGCPPDEFNLNGQDWGLPPLRPDRLRASHYRFFRATLSQSMRGAGALRIDHVMGLMRLFWIPPGKTAADGAYVHYALDEMLAIVALESQRHRCLVIGEDLGTVAAEMRAALARFGVLSCRLLYFEHGEGGKFRSSAEYPREALVAVSTHDLATLAGWWQGHDLRLRQDLGLFADQAIYEQQLIDRTQERIRILLALQYAGLLPEGMEIEPGGSPALTAPLAQAIHAFVASTPSRVMMVQLEDVLGVIEQANLPGTTEAHPNWRRKLPESIENLSVNERVNNLCGALARLRPHPELHLRAASASQARVPRATYRLQFHKGFTFDDAVQVLPFIARLGVSHIYCSPILRARPGSLHGYDIVAHDEINPELGGRDGFERFGAALREHGMGQILDMVPNHMGVLGADNAWWMDVLENGPASVYAQYFDIDWQPVNPELWGKVLVPVLGDHYGHILASNQLAVLFDPEPGTFAVSYHAHRFPIDPGTYPVLLRLAEPRIADASARASVSSLITALGYLPARGTLDANAMEERARDKEMHKARLASVAAEQPGVLQAIEAVLVELNAQSTHDTLHELLEAQAYRLAYWRVAADEINYRRFFDINELAALRMENEQVFEATHAFALELAAAGVVDGLRIDHPDGLYDPAQYFRRLQEGYARRANVALPEFDAQGRPARPLYVVVEKIAALREQLPETWHVHGTTGYRFGAVVNGVLVDASARARFDRIWRVFTHEDRSFGELAYQGKRDIMRSALASELTVLAADLLRIARADRRTRDYTFNTLRNALAEVCACLPVYRTYIVNQPSEQDVGYVEWAVEHARRRSQAAETSIFDFVCQSLLGRAIENAPGEVQAQVRRFAIRFQQFSAPVAAKGVEDTAFYLYGRLASLNEVGGDPDQFGLPVKAFHERAADRAMHWPQTMLATSTHDNKRSEDVRNRINVLSEIPAAWRLTLRRWRAMNRRHRATVDDAIAPSPTDEYLLYQTLLGTLPAAGLDETSIGAYCERIERYMIKAAREAKAHTSWINPNEDYEQALTSFVRVLLGAARANPFLDDLQAQAQTTSWFGALNSLSMVLLKLASPGVPDIYQGNEIMDLSLVDPDNRRPVDFGLRARWLAEMDALPGQGDTAQRVAGFASAPHDGKAKLWLTWRMLALRQEFAPLFRDGAYAGLQSGGARAAHVLAFERQHEGARVLCMAGRLFARLLGGQPRALPLGVEVWQDTWVAVPGLADGTRLENMLTGETLVVEHARIHIAQTFTSFPVAALLVRARKSF
jgi:(1->4)-alpha-D-glucan 1-alpha-D-glucosylmutase